jgi:hypothetical protein
MTLSRMLGHKAIKESEKWQIISNDIGSCWICDKWVYTIVFWSRPFAYKFN